MGGTPLTEAGSRADKLGLVGGEFCLDFANTVGSHAGEHPNDRLRGYADLVAWSRHAAILTADEAHQLAEEAARRPAAAAAVLARAVAVREAIYRIFSARAAGRAPDTADLDLLNGALAEALAHARVVATDRGFAWGWAGDATALDRPLWPIARSAAELLTSGELPRVRECAAEGCGWLFVDASRNRSRRWCDMQDCGNRAKARRHYARSKAAG